MQQFPHRECRSGIHKSQENQVAGSPPIFLTTDTGDSIQTTNFQSHGQQATGLFPPSALFAPSRSFVNLQRQGRYSLPPQGESDSYNSMGVTFGFLDRLSMTGTGAYSPSSLFLERSAQLLLCGPCMMVVEIALAGGQENQL